MTILCSCVLGMLSVMDLRKKYSDRRSVDPFFQINRTKDSKYLFYVHQIFFTNTGLPVVVVVVVVVVKRA